MNYDQMTISELEEIYIKLGREIEKRRNAEKREDWKKLVEQIQLFIERHGPIGMLNEDDKLFYVDSNIDCTVPGMIYLSRI